MTFGIIGFGRFGKLWTKLMSRFGRVFVYDKNRNLGFLRSDPDVRRGRSTETSARKHLKKVVNADFLFLLVPISQIRHCCKRIAKILPQHTIVIDACSVKKYPVHVMKKFLPSHQQIIATHPLFGPDSVKEFGLKNQKIAIVPVRVKEKSLKTFESLLKKLNLKIIKTTAQEHDKKMAASQALVHFIGRSLAKLGLTEQKICTPDYISLLRMNDLVTNDTWQLFFDMQRLNPFSASTRIKFIKTMSRLEQQIEKASAKNIGNFRKLINKTDKEIIEKIALRFRLVEKIGDLKKKKGKDIAVDLRREKALKALHKVCSKKLRLNPAFIERIFSFIINECRKIQC